MMNEVSEQDAAQAQAALAEVVSGLREELDRLRFAVEQLCEEMRFVAGTRQPPPSRRPTLRITSLPKDPAASDFFDRVNAVPPDRSAALRAELVRSARHGTGGQR